MTKFIGNNIALPKLATAPSSPVSGDTYYNTTFNKPYTYNGTDWIDLTLTSATTGANGYWGSFWSTQDQTAASANTEYLITYNNTDADSTGVSVVSNSRITFAYSGVYSLIYSVQWVNFSPTTYDANIWLKKNGSNVADTDSKWSIIGSHGGVDGHAIGSVNYVIKVTAGDYLELAWQATDTAISLQYVPAASPAPAIPSVILTATQVMNTQQVELTNSTSTTSSTIAASATAVKSAYDLASTKVTSGGALGTPSSGTLTNATGLPISTGVSGLGTGVATFLATPSSANLASAVTDETGSGSLVFATSPVFDTKITLPKLASEPSSPVSGTMYFNTTVNKPYTYDGSAWVSLVGSGEGAMNYAQTQATKQSSVSASGVTIVSTSIATNGYPVQVLVTGDAENSAVGGWIKLQLYRDSTAIGKQIHVESSTISENIPYSLTVIDNPAAGTYTYALKTASAAATGTFNFGETDGPVLTAIELGGATSAGVTTLTGTANQITASASTGAVTLSLPQSIATSSSPTFAQVTTTGAIRTATGGADEAVYVGDDAIIADVDTADTLGIYGQQSAANGGMVFGSGKDTNLYRSAANTLKTDDTFVAAALTVNGLITGNQTGTLDVIEGIHLQRTTSLSIASTTLPTAPTTSNTTAITWSSAVKANTQMWSSGSAITAPIAGWYAINMNFQFGTGASYAVGGYIFQGSTLRAHAENQAGANTSADMMNVSAIIYCAANDSITGRVAASTTSKSLTVTTQNGYFSMVYLGGQS